MLSRSQPTPEPLLPECSILIELDDRTRAGLGRLGFKLEPQQYGRLGVALLLGAGAVCGVVGLLLLQVGLCLLCRCCRGVSHQTTPSELIKLEDGSALATPTPTLTPNPSANLLYRSPPASPSHDDAPSSNGPTPRAMLMHSMGRVEASRAEVTAEAGSYTLSNHTPLAPPTPVELTGASASRRLGHLNHWQRESAVGPMQSLPIQIPRSAAGAPALMALATQPSATAVHLPTHLVGASRQLAPAETRHLDGQCATPLKVKALSRVGLGLGLVSVAGEKRDVGSHAAVSERLADQVMTSPYLSTGASCCSHRLNLHPSPCARLAIEGPTAEGGWQSLTYLPSCEALRFDMSNATGLCMCR